MDLSEVRTLAEELISIHSPGWKFEFDNARQRFGCCHYDKKTITMSRHLTPLMEYPEVKDTILHELGHCLTKGHGHNHIWRKKAIELGCDGKTCGDGIYNEIVDSIAKYTGSCPNCNLEIKRNRRRRVACSPCCDTYNNGKFTPQYLFQWK